MATCLNILILNATFFYQQSRKPNIHQCKTEMSTLLIDQQNLIFSQHMCCFPLFSSSFTMPSFVCLCANQIELVQTTCDLFTRFPYVETCMGVSVIGAEL